MKARIFHHLMKAAVFTSHGDTDVLEIHEVEKPTIAHDEVLVDVKAFALNRLDVWTREGLPNLDLDFPHVGGSDFSGIVAEVGIDVSNVEVGDRVAVNPSISCNDCLHCRMGEISLCDEFRLLGEHLWGGAAEFARVPSSNVLKIPDHCSFKETAAIALTGMTSYRMLKSKAKVSPGDWVLITGSGGGIGTAATQLAVFLGARVIALTSSEKKIAKAIELGAEHAINYLEDESWGKTVWNLTGRKGVTAVIDSSGEAVFKQAIRSLAKGGCYVTCGATTGRQGDLNLGLLFWKQLNIMGSTMASHREFEEVMHLFFSGRISPVIDSEYDMDEIQQAHRRQEDPDHMGKIVIEL